MERLSRQRAFVPKVEGALYAACTFGRLPPLL
jgi:hypothetical protein